MSGSSGLGGNGNLGTEQLSVHGYCGHGGLSGNDGDLVFGDG